MRHIRKDKKKLVTRYISKRKWFRRDLGKIQFVFACYFATQLIRLPEHDVKNRRKGKIFKGGWFVNYNFGKDDNGEFLDCLSVHRMTEDNLIRIRVDGTVEHFPTYISGMAVSGNPEEDDKSEAEYYSKMRKYHELIESRGLK